MAEIIRIPDGNAFLLRVTGQIRTGDYTEIADFGVVSDLGINFVRRGRQNQMFSLDSIGRIVIENSGNLSQGVYGVELYGYYHGELWRFYLKNVFQIVNENSNSDSGSDSGNILTYDVTFDVNFGSDGVASDFVVDVKVNNESVVDDDKVANITVPTKTSDLINDAGFIVGDQALSGYVGFSPKNDPSEVTPSDLVAVSDVVSYTFSNVTDGYYLWILSDKHMALYHQGVNVPLYYLGTKNNLHVYRSEAMGVGSFFATFGVGNPNEPIDVVPILYSLSYTMQHISASGPQTIMSTDQVTIFLTADDGYSLPEVVEVTNASVVSYDDETGTLVIGSATGNVTVTAAGEAEVFSVTNNLSSVTNSNDATTAAYGSAYNATLTPASGYEITALLVTMGGVPVSVSDNTIEIASVTGDIVITAVAETAGKVTVNVTSGGVAVQGALVTITIDDEEYTGTTNGNGTVLIVSAVGNGTIKVEKEGYTTYTNTIAVGTGSQTTNISISEIPTFTISGECNVDGVTLHIGSREVVVANGTYSVSGVLAGTYDITCEGYSVAPSSVTVVDTDVDLDITLAGLTSLSGTVTNELEAVVSGATVLLQVDGESYTTTTSSTGEYSFVDVPQGAATLSVTTSGGTMSDSLTLVSGTNTKDMETRAALPTGYTRYDWALLAGNMNNTFLNFTIHSGIKVVAKVKSSPNNTASTRCFGGQKYDSSTQAIQIIGIQINTNYVQGFFGDGFADNSSTYTTDQFNYTYDEDETHVVELSMDGGLVMDGVKLGDIHTKTTFSVSQSVGIGNFRGNTSNVSAHTFNGYVYWVKIYENGVLTHCCVPCRNASNAERIRDIKGNADLSKGGSYTVGND